MGNMSSLWVFFFFFQAEDGIRDKLVTGVQTCALPISPSTRNVCSVSISFRPICSICASPASPSSGGAGLSRSIGGISTPLGTTTGRTEAGVFGFGGLGDLGEAGTEIGRASCRERV